MVGVTPRRLSLMITGLDIQQPKRVVSRTGPLLKQAFDSHQQPTAAGLGFARSCHTDLDALQTIDSPQGARLFYQKD